MILRNEQPLQRVTSDFLQLATSAKSNGKILHPVKSDFLQRTTFATSNSNLLQRANFATSHE